MTMPKVKGFASTSFSIFVWLSSSLCCGFLDALASPSHPTRWSVPIQGERVGYAFPVKGRSTRSGAGERHAVIWLICRHAEAQAMSVGIAHIHLTHTPREIGRKLPDIGSARFELSVQHIHIVYPDTHPRARIALTVLAKEDLDAVAAHAAKGWWLLPAPPTGEAQFLHVVGDTCLHIVNRENGVDTLQLRHGDDTSSVLSIMGLCGTDISMLLVCRSL